MKMDFDVYTERLVSLVRDAEETETDADFNARYDLIMNEALASGWTHSELWAEADRRFEAEMTAAIKRISQEEPK